MLFNNFMFQAFAPVVEQPHDGALITQPMYESVESGKINKIPLIIGYNSEEEIQAKGGGTISFRTLSRFRSRFSQTNIAILETVIDKRVAYFLKPPKYCLNHQEYLLLPFANIWEK